MKNYFDEICKKLNKEIEIEDIEIVDNSHKHKGHKFYSPEKFHLQLKNKIFIFKLFIKSECTKNNNEILSDDLKTKIHALEISIEK